MSRWGHWPGLGAGGQLAWPPDICRLLARSGRVEAVDEGECQPGAPPPGDDAAGQGSPPRRQTRVQDEQDGLRASADVAVDVAAGREHHAELAVGEAQHVLAVVAEMDLVGGL